MAKENRMNIYEKLLNIQMELKAPKNQTATDKNGKPRYTYRSCEDILEALKPLLTKYKLLLTIQDSIEQHQNRIYVRAKAILIDFEKEGTTELGGEPIEKYIYTEAYARETEDNGRMDAAQITGAASSYARKYALNGLFLIDDTRDVDTNEYREAKHETKLIPDKTQKAEETTRASWEYATPEQIHKMEQIAKILKRDFDLEAAQRMTVMAASDFIKKYAEVLNG